MTQAAEFCRRRAHFMSMIGAQCIAIIPNYSQQTRNSDVHFSFRSNSDFYYLTGFDEPDAVAVFLSEGKGKGKFILFCAEKDPVKELWDGKMIGLDAAMSEYGADDAYPIEDMEDILPGHLENRDSLIYNMGSHTFLDVNLVTWINHIKEHARAGAHAPKDIVSPDHVLHEMRLFKSRSEISKMSKAAKITTKAHIRAMQRCTPKMTEYEIEAELLYECNKAGCKMPAYPSIVAGGNNACTLHYIENNQPLAEGDLLLIDAGSEYENYASDVTRTFPVNGKFSEAQRELYEVVLDAQEQAIAAVRPGIHWNVTHEIAVKVITKGLLKLGIIQGTLKQALAKELYRPFFMHRTGHWLGMDVHDVGEYKVRGKWRELEPGMVFTVEPGIYIPLGAKSGSKQVAKKYQGIGIRIEDDIVVTKDGHKVLTDKIPKTVAEIEATMAK